jgi:hypothetical protein
VACDFNTIPEVYDKNCGRDLYVPQLKSFYDCLQFCHLFDMRARGWSWSKKSVESRRIMVRLRLSWAGASGWIGLTLQDQRYSASSSSSHEIRPAAPKLEQAQDKQEQSVSTDQAGSRQ